MKKIASVSELKKGDVVLVIGYDTYNCASGDADGWFSEIYSVDDTKAVAPDGVEYEGDCKLVQPEGEPLDLNKSQQRGWIPLYDSGGTPNTIRFCYDGGAHACSFEVAVVLLQRGRLSDITNREEDEFDDDQEMALVDQQVLTFEN